MPRSTPLKVLVIGAGTGGLCLAHGLHARGIDVRLFERDRTPTDRIQGYRLNISATGNRALEACLPPDNYRRFVEASARSSTGVFFFDHHLNRLWPSTRPKSTACRSRANGRSAALPWARCCGTASIR